MALVEVTPGVHLAVRYAGAADAPPMLLLHGLGESSASWDGLLPALARSHRVIAPDLRGHGASDRPGTYSYELLRDDVLALLDGLAVEVCVLVGHSMGAMVAMLLAEAAPARFSRLVLEDAAPTRPGAWRRPRPQRPGPEVDLPFDWALLDQLYDQMYDPDPAWWEDAASVAVPTLVVAGGPESTSNQDEIATLVSRMPDARLVTIPVGHFVHTQAPDEFLAALRRFLQPAVSRGRRTGRTGGRQGPA